VYFGRGEYLFVRELDAHMRGIGSGGDTGIRRKSYIQAAGVFDGHDNSLDHLSGR
jgi:hypothetical protein